MSRFPAEALSRITLGTVQFGMPYGKAKPTLPPDARALAATLDAALDGGITCLDTAGNYGDAESRIGGWLRGRRDRPLIVSKLPPVDRPDEDVPGHVDTCLAASLAALGVDRLDGYLVHRADDLHRPGVADRLRAAVDDGRIRTFGVSVYEPRQLDRALAVAGIGAVQLPASVFDQRFADAGLIGRCADRGIVVFVRSLFLQGALFLEPDRLPPHLLPLQPAMRHLRAIAAEAGCPLASLALAAVLTLPGVTSAVIGVGSPQELCDNLAACKAMPPDEAAASARKAAGGLPDAILDVRRWPAYSGRSGS